MEAYRPIMLNGAHLVALYAIAYISSAQFPQNILEYIVLGMASAWLFYGTYLLQLDKKRVSSLFFAAIAAMPWAFYGEMWYINNHREGIPDDVFAANVEHAIMIYQSFKYMFLFCAAGVAVIGLYQSVRSFGNTGLN